MTQPNAAPATTIAPAFTGAERLPLPPQNGWTSAQVAAAAELSAGPRGGVIGPFKPLLYSPDLMQRVQKTGEYLRYNTGLDKRLTELAILVVAHHWGQPVEWNIHYPIALQAGVNQADADAIAVGDAPKTLDAEQRIVYEFCRAVLRDRAVSDRQYAEATAAFGEKSVVDLTTLCGYYSLLAMVMNVARTPD
jgi:4-carboxymuconolactone decarboxylase